MRYATIAALVASLCHGSIVFAEGPIERSALRAIQEQSGVQNPAPPTAKKAFLWSGMAVTAAGIGLYADTFLKEECIDRTGGIGTTTPCTQTTKNTAVRNLGLGTMITGAVLLTTGMLKGVDVRGNSVSYRVRF